MEGPVTCIEEGCDRPVAYRGKGLCSRCYQKKHRWETGRAAPDGPPCECGHRLVVLWTRAIGKAVVRMRQCNACKRTQPTVETFISVKTLERTGERLLMDSYDRMQQPKDSPGKPTVGSTAS